MKGTHIFDSKLPNEQLIFAFLDGDPRAREIVTSWRTRLFVTRMTKEGLEESSDRCRTTFDFPRTGDNPLPSYSDPDLPLVQMTAPSDGTTSDDAEG